ncbi:MAG: hypothetical protein GX234_04425 [Clostridiales bacterium]|nr:hypothetical protein [Clostridiales bacterium]
MQKQFHLKKGTPYPLGVSAAGTQINFAAVMNTKEKNGILLYERSTRKLAARIPFCAKESTGNICCGMLENFEPDQYLYNFYSGDLEYTDPYARAVCGNRKKYGEFRLSDEYDWEEDNLPEIPYTESIFYLLHVRGFTMHRTSGVEHKGTFLGIQEKIPYLKELGITTLELMPAYEFEEKEPSVMKEPIPVPEYMQERYRNAQDIIKSAAPFAAEEKKKKSVRLNYWGYKSGSYFAPKRSYAAGERPDVELKNLIKELHRNHMEIILQFYFPKEVKQGYILEVLKYWILNYHVDGIHIKGERIPITLLATEPLLANRKLLHHELPLQEIYGEGEQPAYRNLAFYRDDFMYDMRKYLKGDDNMLQSVVEYTKRNTGKAAFINFMTNYYGFTLEDLVSYDRKHNEANGEENHDGTDFNFSWNCGAEGKTRRKSVNELRLKQKKNAMTLMLLSQGTPLIRAGDEFCQTQKGNNNPYCQDNDISWLHWDRMEQEKEFFEFVKMLIKFRMEQPVFHMEEPFRMVDYRSYGYPDLSLHGEEAWKAYMHGYEHHIGMLYCGRYAMPSIEGQGTAGKEADREKAVKQEPAQLFYAAYNMHWQRHFFGLPSLPEGEEWKLVFTTDNNTSEAEQLIRKQEENKQEKGCRICIPPRTISLFKSQKSARKSRNRSNGGSKRKKA